MIVQALTMEEQISGMVEWSTQGAALGAALMYGVI